MKRILLLSIASLTMLMADFTLIGEELTPVTETTAPVVEPTPTPPPVPTTGSAKTNWGFQPFSIPNDSVTVEVGGDIQAAINSLPNGGTVNLKAGTYYGARIILKSNIVLQGAGRDSTTIKFNGSSEQTLMQLYGGEENLILRNFKADATGTINANGISLSSGSLGANNILVENLEILGADKGNLVIYNSSWGDGSSSNITFRNIISHDTKTYHAIQVRFSQGVVVDNCTLYNAGEYGIDFSRVKYAEIANCSIDSCTGGTKFPGSNYIYIHDTKISNSGSVGIKFRSKIGDGGTGIEYFHLENVEVTTSAAGVVDWGDEYAPQTFEELVLIGNNIHGNNYNTIRVRGANNAHEYGDNIGLTEARAGTVNSIPHPTGTPEADGAGWTSWPKFN